MEIKIIGKPVVEAIIDLETFKCILAETMNLEKAVKDSLRIESIRAVKRETFVSFLFLYMDWGKLIDHMKFTDKREMRVKMMEVKYKDMPLLEPDIITENYREYSIKNKNVDGDGFIFIQDIVNHPSFVIGNFLNENVWRYAGNDEWKSEIRLE